MKIRNILAGVAILLVAIAAIGYHWRKELVLQLVAHLARTDVAPTQEIHWQQGPEAAETPPAQRPPNIIFILADDLGINDVSTFGKGRVPTPNIDRIAHEGAVFRHAYAGNATCAPSRAALLTGRYPSRTGFEFTPTPNAMGRVISMFMNDRNDGRPPVLHDREAARKLPPAAEQVLPGEEVTIAEMLKEVGYHTVHIGKWHLGNTAGSSANAQGFDESLLRTGMLYLEEDDPDAVNARLDFDPIDKFLWANGGFSTSYNNGPLFKPPGYVTDWWTDEAVKVIRANRNRPFFLYFAHWAVHSPLQATREDYEAVAHIQPHRARVYAAMVRALDRSVGRVLDELRAQGLDDNTLVVFSSDNGGAGYIGVPDVNEPYRGWKMTFFEGGIRVPLYARWPARIPAGTTIDRPAAHIDLAPTLAAAAGAPLPQGVAIDGIDLFSNAARPDDALFWKSGHYRAVRQGDWKLQLSERPKKAWLFNLAADPTEKDNRAGHEPEKLAALTTLLADYERNARPALYPYNTEGPVTIDKTSNLPADENDEYVYWAN